MRPYYGLSFILLLFRQFFFTGDICNCHCLGYASFDAKTNKNLENESALRFLAIIS